MRQVIGLLGLAAGLRLLSLKRRLHYAAGDLKSRTAALWPVCEGTLTKP